MNYPTPIWVPEVGIHAGANTPLFSIGSYDFRVYSLMIMLGIIASVLSITFFWYRAKYKIEILMTFILITVPSAIIGARLGFVVEELLYSPAPFAGSHWYAIWDGGLSIQGGVILAVILDLWYGYTQRDQIDMRKVASYIIPTILIGQFIGRWGNYANHELYGRIDYSGQSSLIFGKSFAQNMYIIDILSESLFGQGGAAYRYPLFLYEGIANIIGYIIIVWIFNLFGIFKPGATSGLYFVHYGIVRSIMEPYRQDSYNLYVIVSIAFAIVGVIVFIYFEFFSRTKYNRVKKSYYWDWEYVSKKTIENRFSLQKFLAKFK
ncbi:prolipoprotein diacylglyceryl transferase [Mycoplasma anatis]|uniref:prolipoprotein diacylglyceryl transferase n=1 Tax=Mycoplasmopsis anatis TaxID=171279 RepID=UPI001C4E1DC4|nr:prolipoprotein diacylglyceryl transferase [Mycoplasmopsis anatis]MBW0599146.1 prolipoprotein diacylglyceryl transferase [Mycoplasmopsis anatis]MBW0603549.1 prolipoprotein diacylglyceryl transferase [Mycoplasmopsis anatis]